MNLDWDQLPPLPAIGHPESYYGKQVHAADRMGNVHGREPEYLNQDDYEQLRILRNQWI